MVEMKLGKITVLFFIVTLFLAGCNSRQSSNSIESTPNAVSPVKVDSSPTPEMTDIITSTNSVTWETGIREIFEMQCSECHSSTPTGGFSITSYTKVLQGSNLGPIIIPGNPAESHLFYKLKFGGNHPGYMSSEQTEMVREWVSNGAPEK